MITLFNNKNQLFECKIKIEGAKYKSATPRLVLKDGEKNIFFEGKIDKGKCIINLPALSEAVKQTGDVILEIVVDNAIFNPYQSKYEIINSANQIVAEEIKITSKTIIEKKPKKEIKNIFKKNITETNKKIAEEMLSAYGSLAEMHKKLLKGHVEEIYKPTQKSIDWANKVFHNPKSITAKICMYEYDSIGGNEKNDIPEEDGKKSLYRQILGL